ncbi:MAG: M23 family metallopeptidase [Bacteroidales bacterium]|jgi:hypothetical protein|nr:M23 family metallopeptidase [Bacteroidales bacterium]
MSARRNILLLILSLWWLRLHGQPAGDTVFHRPLDIPVLLAATFGELRNNHFHSGIDYRTQGVTGHKVRAAADGYVSRIKVEAGGYGKALYVAHPNGYTTVYAHLDLFCGEVADYVKQQQYARRQFATDLFPDSAQFVVRRGQQIAVSGNTGGSSGPHLHFEVRETSSEKPVNPLHFGLGVKDDVAPVMRRLAVYPIGEGSTVNGSREKLILQLEQSGGRYIIKGGQQPVIRGQAAFGVDAYDRLSGSANRCGLYRLSLRIDTSTVFSQTMNSFSFDETRYINSLIDYAYYVEHNVRFNRLYMEPNNRLSIYDRHIRRGVVSFADSSLHRALLTAEDLHGNSARLEFSFTCIPEREQPKSFLEKIAEMPDVIAAACETEVTYNRPYIRVTIPAFALYDRIRFEYDTSRQPPSLYSDVHHVHRSTVPLHKAITVEIDANRLPVRLREKALIVQVGRNGRVASAGGYYRDQIVVTSVRSFGSFAVSADTVPPRIVPVNLTGGGDMRKKQNIRIKITDDLSGVGTYSGWIDGQWALFEYDAKNSVLVYEFDGDRLKKNAVHRLLLEVTDVKGNAAEYRTEFTW